MVRRTREVDIAAAVAGVALLVCTVLYIPFTGQGFVMVGGFAGFVALLGPRMRRIVPLEWECTRSVWLSVNSCTPSVR